MAIVVEFDKYVKQQGKYTSDGWEIERKALVTGLTGVGSKRFYDAVMAILADNPLGTSHPHVEGCLLQEIIPEFEDIETVSCQLIYREPSYSFAARDIPQIEIGASLNGKVDNRDANGDLITVSYTYPTPYKWEDPNATPTQKKAGTTETVSKEVPYLGAQMTLSITKKQYYSPENLAANFVGCINKYAWRGYVASAWLCTGISGRSNDNGRSYDVTYTFQCDLESTWKQHLVWIDPHDGAPPSDLVTDTGDKWVQMYPSMDFAGLGL